jgi:hypothetical protein
MQKSLRDLWKSAHAGPLPPLANGLRASTGEGQNADGSSIGGPRAFPFRSMRRLIDSLTWYQKGEQFLGGNPSDTSVPQGPDFTCNHEVQGIAYAPDYMYLVSTDALWAVRHDNISPKNLRGSEIFSFDNDGLHYEGRRHLRKKDLERTPGPKHLSAPSLYHGRLLVPAEGDPRGDGQQWVWVFDTTTLGYLGRIGLDSVNSGLANEIAWCSADEESGLLYASRYSDAGHVAVFRLPPLSGLVKPPAEDPAVDVEFSHPTLPNAEYVGGMTLIEKGIPAGLSKVQGGVVTSSGHLYLNFMKVKNKTAWGILGFDLLTGKAIKYISLGSADEGLQKLQGITVSENQLRVLIWDTEFLDEAAEFVGAPSRLSADHPEYSVFNFGLNDPGERW